MTRHSVLTTPLRVPTAGAGPPMISVDNICASTHGYSGHCTVPRPVGTGPGTGGTVPASLIYSTLVALKRLKPITRVISLHFGGFKEAEAYY